ncbi:MAG: hypothetical protein OHK0039_31040 [Bacteroidia bacterium]
MYTRYFPLLALLWILTGLSEVSAQEVVKVRPRPPQTLLERQHCDGNHIWIDGEWEWDKTANEYRWVYGCCVRTRNGYQYVSGRWQWVDKGWVWVPGRWEKLSTNSTARL